ncbi:hypothetical protein DFH09DRAFT_447707 [Mycena vulgaris]|nr:hypothetical protein DFH09DRAFT_447707 [Mycena vulgaris]
MATSSCSCGPFFSLPPFLDMSQQIIVDVGVNTIDPGASHQFSPNTVSAPAGSTITFRFSASSSNHSVTQSTFDGPCTPVQGGLDSGFQAVQAGQTNGFPVWSFVVEDDQQPLWFFCRQSSPDYHCTAGMVFALNPAPQSSNNDPGPLSDVIFQDFQLKAVNAGPISRLTVSGQATVVHLSPRPPGTTTTVIDKTRTIEIVASSVTTTASPNTTGPVGIAVPFEELTVDGKIKTLYGFGDKQATSGSATIDSGSSTHSDPGPSTIESGSSTPQPGGAHVPVAAIVGAVLGSLVLLSLCLAAIVIRRQRARRRYGSHRNAPRELGLDTSTDSIVIDLTEGDNFGTRPHPLILYDVEKNAEKNRPHPSPPADSAELSSENTSPVAAELALANIAAEMQLMRSQMQRIETERTSTADELPPQYAPH